MYFFEVNFFLNKEVFLDMLKWEYERAPEFSGEAISTGNTPRKKGGGIMDKIIKLVQVFAELIRACAELIRAIVELIRTFIRA